MARSRARLARSTSAGSPSAARAASAASDRVTIAASG
jgi:hypothetical protein